MPNTTTLSIEIDPVGWQRPGQGRYGNRYTESKTATFQEQIRLAWRSQSGKKADGPIAVSLFLAFRMPKSWSKKKKESMAGKPMTSKPDADNVAKSILDALNKKAWEDDAQVYKVFVTKVWGWEPCITVTIRGDQHE